MTEIILTQRPHSCDDNRRLPDENGKPSNYFTDKFWHKSTAIDTDINFYDIYWAPGTDTDNKPTAIICDKKDVTKNIIIANIE